MLLLVKAAVLTWLIINGAIGLSPDEAQYWTWSQVPDWGYYSKPPGIAWEIWFGTELYGNSLLGIRAPSVVLGFCLPLAVYALAKACRYKTQCAFWAAIILACSPLGILGSFLAITDTGMILFWTLAYAVIALALSKEMTPHYYLVGFCIACGALFKWPIYLIWSFVIGMLPFYPSLRSKHLIGGILVSLLGIIPSFIWNASHHWVTMRHVFHSVQGSKPGTLTLLGGNFLDFLAAQAALLSPILFILLLIAFVFLIKKSSEIPPQGIFCGLSALVILGMMLSLSLFKKVQGNWADFAYPSAIVFMSWYCLEKTAWGERWIKGGVALSLAATAMAFAIPFVQSNNLMPQVQIAYKANPFKHNLGWKALEQELLKVQYNPEEDFLFSNKYQTTSILSFYGPQKKRAYFFNISDVRKNQFTYWPSMADEQLGKTGYFVLIENIPHLDAHIKEIDAYSSLLAPYFDSVEFLGVKPLFYAYGQVAKAALIYRASGYNGKTPPETEKY